MGAIVRLSGKKWFEESRANPLSVSKLRNCVILREPALLNPD
jgi:hypothetical protein